MKILLFGKGVLPTILGWCLAKAGHSVFAYVRSEPKDAKSIDCELELLDARKDPQGLPQIQTWKIPLISELRVDHDFDLVLFSVSPENLEGAAKDLGGKLSNASVLVMNNFWTDPAQLYDYFPQERVVWGVPVAGGEWNANHLEAALMKTFHVGKVESEASDRQKAVFETLKGLGFTVNEHADFRSWLWINFALSAATAATALTQPSLDDFLPSAKLWRTAILTARETFAVAFAHGASPKAVKKETEAFSLPAWIGAIMIQGALKKNTPARRIMELNNRVELLKLFPQEVLNTAKQLGLACPRLSKSVENWSV